ncbi:vacuolar protein sorting-associated protein 37B-like isoform X2 [Daphnia carinata]|uniref:vacuolar protein sorting-associated protein 37B-like isoform X2 n=1 Tax=Daphnia carinata TaxID=120202 RepID=UPI00257EB641|nr:vacuolar protein sorting-associated protein 37B-like isoform X2 [Daphnia carinata]
MLMYVWWVHCSTKTMDDPRTVTVMGLLQHCNSSELKELLNEDARLEFIIRDSQLVKQQEGEKDMLLASNKSLAEYNLTWEPKISSRKQKLVELYQIGSQLERSQEEKEKRMEEQGDSITLDTAIGLLQSATLQAEEESEQLADKFLDRALDVDTFVEEFQQRRKMAHLRKVKADKMKELVAKQKHSAHQHGISTHIRPAPPLPSYVTHSSSANPPPYPIQNAPGNLPYPIFPPNNASSMPYPIYPNCNVYDPRM